MIDNSTLDALLEAGASSEVIVGFVKSKQAKVAERNAARRERDRQRKRTARALKKPLDSTPASTGHARTSEDVVDEKERFPHTPSKEIYKSQTARVRAGADVLAILETVLDSRHAQAVVDHRDRLGAPLTQFTADVLAKQFAGCESPEGAAETMVLAGWKSFDRAWLENRRKVRDSGTGPPSAKSHQTVSDYALQLLEYNDEFESAYAAPRLFPRGDKEGNH